MATVVKQEAGLPSLRMDIPLAPVSRLAKPQRPKSKSLQPCRCPEEGCGKMFSKRSNLKAHMRVHSGVLPYPCEFPGCTKRFRWKSSLKPHVKVHFPAGTVAAGNSGNSMSNSSFCTSSSVTSKKSRSQGGGMSSLKEPSTPGMKPVFRGGGGGSGDTGVPIEKVMTGMGNTLIESCIFESPVTPESESREYMCYFAGCQEKFGRMSMLLEHEVMMNHQGNRPQVVRALFQDSSFAEQGEIDLSCNSVLSDSQESGKETDVGSFTLDSGVEDAGGITEELWKTDISVVDPLMDFSEWMIDSGSTSSTSSGGGFECLYL